jgi:hypothetical protein
MDNKDKKVTKKSKPIPLSDRLNYPIDSTAMLVIKPDGTTTTVKDLIKPKKET